MTPQECKECAISMNATYKYLHANRRIRWAYINDHKVPAEQNCHTPEEHILNEFQGIILDLLEHRRTPKKTEALLREYDYLFKQLTK